jgi:hypothetical protein
MAECLRRWPDSAIQTAAEGCTRQKSHPAESNLHPALSRPGDDDGRPCYGVVDIVLEFVVVGQFVREHAVKRIALWQSQGRLPKCR